MNLHTPLALFALLLLGLPHGQAAITIPSADGSDGALNVAADTVIDLSQAVTGNWNASNAANAGKGIYDASKWAVVFKYTNVTVAAGKTLTFTNHASRAPVIWLVSGNVTIDGTVSLDGKNFATEPSLAEPGPGGFRGATGYFAAGVGASAGFGVGGGQRGGSGLGASYGSVGGGGPAVYGNPALIPLIGGSGGGGGMNDSQSGGGGGGGAILIASGGTLTINGSVRANGGRGNPSGWEGGSGSGGGIRLVSDSLAGTGVVSAVGGIRDDENNAGGVGRVRIERVNNTNAINVTPDPSVVPLASNDTALLWPPASAPEVKIVSIGEQNVPADPRAGFGTIGPDVALPQTPSTQVVIQTTNVEQTSQVKVRCTPRSDANFTEVSATVASVVSTTPLVVRWNATLQVTVGYSAVQVKVVRP